MPKHRDLTTYKATLDKLKLQAFGMDQIIPWHVEIEIYQARVHPELWRARPSLRRQQRTWEAGTAEALMAMVESDFCQVLKPWIAYADGRYPIAMPVDPAHPSTGRRKTG